MKPLLCFMSSKINVGCFLINLYSVFITNSHHDAIKIFFQSLLPALPSNTLSSLLYLRCLPPPCNSSNLYIILVICTSSVCLFPACCWDHSRRMGWLIQILPNRVEGFSVLLHLLSRNTLVVAIPSVLTVTWRLNNWQANPLPVSSEISQLIKNISEGDQPFRQILFSWKMCWENTNKNPTSKKTTKIALWMFHVDVLINLVYGIACS